MHIHTYLHWSGVAVAAGDSNIGLRRAWRLARNRLHKYRDSPAQVYKYDQWGPRHDSGDGSASTAAGTLHLTRLRRHADMIARAASYCILNCISLTPTASRTQGTASPLEAPRVPSQHSAHDAVRRPVLRDAQRAAQHTPQKRARAQATAGEVRF